MTKSKNFGDRLLVALERINHTFHRDSYQLPGAAKDKMANLKKRRLAELGMWQLIAAYLLCKRPYIAIGTFGASVHVSHHLLLGR